MDKSKARELALKYASIVCDKFAPNEIVLFGSYVNGTPNLDSDIDIAIVFDGYEGDYLKDSASLWGLTRKVSLLIEPIILDIQADESGFAHKVLANGEPLLEKTVD